MANKIKDEIIVEVTEVKQKSEHLQGYDKPTTKFTEITMSSGGNQYSGMRYATVRIAGDVPIGTRFRVIVEQVDEVTAATIFRGTLPNVVEAPAQLKSSE
jgi:hypothetical protein